MGVARDGIYLLMQIIRKIDRGAHMRIVITYAS